MTGETLRQEVERLVGKRLLVVHRIDRDASGLVIFAKDESAHRRLCKEFGSRRVKKKYMVLVDGDIRGRGVIDEPLREFGSGRVGVDPRGKASTTRYRVKKRYGRASLLEVEPETGRRHQIRVHLYHLGHPVWGDRRYGSPRPVGRAPRLMLHAWRVRLTGPCGVLDLKAELPRDFLKVLDSLGGV